MVARRIARVSRLVPRLRRSGMFCHAASPQPSRAGLTFGGGPPGLEEFADPIWGAQSDLGENRANAR